MMSWGIGLTNPSRTKTSKPCSSHPLTMSSKVFWSIAVMVRMCPILPETTRLKSIWMAHRMFSGLP